MTDKPLHWSEVVDPDVYEATLDPNGAQLQGDEAEFRRLNQVTDEAPRHYHDTDSAETGFCSGCSRPMTDDRRAHLITESSNGTLTDETALSGYLTAADARLRDPIDDRPGFPGCTRDDHALGCPCQAGGDPILELTAVGVVVKMLKAEYPADYTLVEIVETWGPPGVDLEAIRALDPVGDR
jgi:hypothetical protein